MAQTNGKKSLIQILGERGKINREQAVEAMQRKQATTVTLEAILVDMGVPETEIYDAQATSMNVPFLDVSKVQTTPDAKGLIPEDMQERYGVAPIRLDGKRLTIAMANPKDVFALDEMRMKTGLDVQAVMVTPTHMQKLRNGDFHANGNGTTNGTAASPEAIESAGVDGEIEEMLGLLAPAEDFTSKGRKETKNEVRPDEDEEVDIGAMAEAARGGKDGEAASGVEGVDEAPIIRIVNTVLMYAIKDGASDIHIEPQQKGVRIRYRIDGVLHEQMKVPQYVLNPLVSRIKIMADMNIAERRVPQDGRIHIKMHDKDYDMRVSSLPTAYGEKIVMRILDKSSVMIGLDKLGLYPETQEQLLDMCMQPNGMFLICGPTGSGKTTTLYSALNVTNSVEKNVMTVEDPVEYQLPGLSQVHVNRKAGLTFANALRAFLRQDPDVIMVGETRDLETAEIAVQASLTGHLVLTTIHTNDAPSVPTRLADMGVEPFLISASMIGALAQRLARKICENCKEEYTPQRELLLRMGFDPKRNPDVQFYKGHGCDTCRQTGFKGRIGLYELMRINEELAEMFVRRAPVSEIKEAARANGMHTLQEDGLRKAKDGLTTIEEIMRVVFTGGH